MKIFEILLSLNKEVKGCVLKDGQCHILIVEIFACYAITYHAWKKTYYQMTRTKLSYCYFIFHKNILHIIKLD